MTIRKLEIIPKELEVKMQLVRIMTDLRQCKFGSAIEFLEQCEKGRSIVKQRIISGKDEDDMNCYRYSVLLKHGEPLIQLFKTMQSNL
jgi:hypothetical protein